MFLLELGGPLPAPRHLMDPHQRPHTASNQFHHPLARVFNELFFFLATETRLSGSCNALFNCVGMYMCVCIYGPSFNLLIKRSVLYVKSYRLLLYLKKASKRKKKEQ